MKYNLLEKSVYLKSRYELIALLEDIQPIRESVYSGVGLFNVVANNCEKYMDICFPQIPFSEERLVLFSHLYGNAGEIDIDLRRALVTNKRALIWFSLLFSGNNKRSFYEAELFGLFDNPHNDGAEETQMIVDCFSAPYKNDQTYWQYLESYKLGYCSCNYKSAVHALCLHVRLKPIIQQLKNNTGISRVNSATLCINRE